MAYAQSVIPISAVLFVVGQLLVFPEVLREARGEADSARRSPHDRLPRPAVRGRAGADQRADRRGARASRRSRRCSRPRASRACPTCRSRSTRARPAFRCIAIPLFILAGAIMNTSGISHRLIDFCQALVGWMRGALAQVNVLSHMFFAEISGSAVAGVAATASDHHPGHEEARLPGPVHGRGDLVHGHARDHHPAVDPDDPLRGHGRHVGGADVRRRHRARPPRAVRLHGPVLLVRASGTTGRWRRSSSGASSGAPSSDAFWALTLPIIILGGIFGGVVTATEGAALAVVAALLVGGLIYRELDWARLREAIIDGAVQTGAVMLLVAASALLGALSHRGAAAAAHRARRCSSITSEKWADPRDPQRLLPRHRHVPALGGGDHPGGADRDAGW